MKFNLTIKTIGGELFTKIFDSYDEANMEAFDISRSGYKERRKGKSLIMVPVGGVSSIKVEEIKPKQTAKPATSKTSAKSAARKPARVNK